MDTVVGDAVAGEPAAGHPVAGDAVADVPADWSETLRRQGYRLTVQRVRVLDAVRTLAHATPEAVADRAGVDLSTVYRTLDLLDELGLVTHAHLGSGSPSYHLASAEPHVHLVCRTCGRVEEVPPEVVAEVVARLDAERGFSVDVAHMAVTGTCSRCRERGGPGEHGQPAGP